MRMAIGAAAIANNIDALIKIEPLKEAYSAEIKAGIIESQKRVRAMIDTSPLRLIMPRERWRAVIAYTILVRGLEFILLHEIGHILRGHIALSRKFLDEDWRRQIVEFSRG